MSLWIKIATTQTDSPTISLRETHGIFPEIKSTPETSTMGLLGAIKTVCAAVRHYENTSVWNNSKMAAIFIRHL